MLFIVVGWLLLDLGKVYMLETPAAYAVGVCGKNKDGIPQCLTDFWPGPEKDLRGTQVKEKFIVDAKVKVNSTVSG